MRPDAALVILGSLERWIWSNDRRHRAFYCAPRAHVPCRATGAAAPANESADADGGGGDGGGGGPAAAEAATDCYEAEAVRPCLDQMLLRAARYARLTWPDSAAPPGSAAPPAPPRGDAAATAAPTAPGPGGVGMAAAASAVPEVRLRAASHAARQPRQRGRQSGRRSAHQRGGAEAPANPAATKMRPERLDLWEAEH
eukprot:Transcript_31101.p2 GENE.Transcript_31101~~Transcript_31101.p2  ORF type:complete len:198 (-),score=43.44 Transcript_31101:191-784(-)